MSHELLIALGALLIIIIFIDGIRRVRNSRHDRIRMSRRKQPIFDDDLDENYGSELPNGGARVISVRADDEAEQLQEEIRKTAEENKPKLRFAKEDDEHLPVDDGFPAEGEPLDSEDASAHGVPAVETPLADEERQAVDDSPPEPVSRKKTPAKKRRAKKQPEQASLELDQPKPDSRPQEVIVFHLRAGKDATYNGQSLLEALVEEGMRYGAMDIFHCHAQSDGSGDVLFSMANSVEPGTFDLNTMEQLETPGVSFFIDLGAVDDPSEAFGKMLNTIAGCIEKLGGELKDETRSDVTKQTVEHYWQRVRDFERRTLSEGA